MKAEEARALFLSRFGEAYERNPNRTIIWVQGHQARVAGAARKIARQMVANGCESVDPEEAYVAALLHDFGKSSPEWKGLNHVSLGYRMLSGLGLEGPARIALTHNWYGYGEFDRNDELGELSPGDRKLVMEFMEGHEMKDLDLLVQLVDNMAYQTGVMTVSDRFGDILVRHNLKDAGKRLAVLYSLKERFDKKCGMNIYELFREDIIRTTVDEPNERGSETVFEWREDEL